MAKVLISCKTPNFLPKKRTDSVIKTVFVHGKRHFEVQKLFSEMQRGYELCMPRNVAWNMSVNVSPKWGKEQWFSGNFCPVAECSKKYMAYCKKYKAHILK